MTDSAHRVHGLAADEVPPDWPPLAGAELSRLLDRYPGRASPRSVRWHSPRPLSAAALVDTAGGRVFVKRHHHSVRSVATLAEEHAFMAHLRAAGVPVPDVLTDADGVTAVALDGWTYEIHVPAPGLDLYRDTISWMPLRDPDHARTAGAMLARLHDAAAAYAVPQRDTHILVARSELIEAVDPLAALAAQLPSRPGLADYLHERDWRRELAGALAPFHAAAQPRLARQARLWTHGDWHVSNLCWSDVGLHARVTAVLDFGLAARTFALFDLATAIERNAIAWLEPGADIARPRIAQALLDGYRARRPLGRDELDLLADLLPIVHVDFALSEVEYFNAITGSKANADVAWNTFLRGHAAWFRSTPGRTLRDALRQM
jgi:Ser/Thr protein kinase RdoA (MazF antagonist)